MKHILSRAALAIATLCMMSALLAHEFWLQPDRFRYQKNQHVNIKFLVGENFTGENWGGNNKRIKTLQLFAGGKTTDLSPLIGPATGDSLRLQLTEEGTSVIAFNSNNSFIRLDPEKFNAYLAEDGLTDILEYREKHRETDSTGQEFYQRSVKTILQTGSLLTEEYRQPTGLPLDIIPQANPYSYTDTGMLVFRILFKGNPLPHQLCKIWMYREGKTRMLEQTTDSEGVISISIKPEGRWMVSTVKMIPADEPGAQWQSYWGSVTWGYY